MMSIMRPGKISKGFSEYDVTCARCEYVDIGHWRTMKQFEYEIRDSGWKTIQGKWVCSKCIAPKEW